MSEFTALYLANSREFVRDKMATIIVLLLPVSFAVFFGLIFGGGEDGAGMVDVYMPGMLGVALLWLGLFGTALPLMQQRKGQVLRRLSVTPLRPATMLGANIGWRVTVGLMQAALFVLVGWVAFRVGVQGNKLLFAGTVALGALVFVSLGYALAGMSSSEEGLMAVTQIINIPMMMVSGGLFPVGNLPAFFKPLVIISPLTYLTDALGQLMAGAPALNPLWLDYAVLGAWLAVLLVLGVKLWRWE